MVVIIAISLIAIVAIIFAVSYAAYAKEKININECKKQELQLASENLKLAIQMLDDSLEMQKNYMLAKLEYDECVIKHKLAQDQQNSEDIARAIILS
jgi:hypothetical protein